MLTLMICFVGKPKAVVSIKPDTHVYIGEMATLKCDIQGGGGGGDTEWTFILYMNKKRLFPDGKYQIYTDNTQHELRFRPVRDLDSGDYTCRGHRLDNQSSEISDTVPLTVSGKTVPVYFYFSIYAEHY